MNGENEDVKNWILANDAALRKGRVEYVIANEKDFESIFGALLAMSRNGIFVGIENKILYVSYKRFDPLA